MTQTSDTGRSSRMPRWLKAVFALSLAANLAVVGLVAGAALREDRSGRSRHKAPPPPAAAEAIGAVMYRSLDRDSRRVLRDLADGQYGNIVERRIAELNALLEVIRSEPLDVTVLRARIDAQTAAINEFRGRCWRSGSRSCSRCRRLSVRPLPTRWNAMWRGFANHPRVRGTRAERATETAQVTDRASSSA